MKRRFKQCWSTILPISTIETIISHLKSLNIKNTPTYGIGDPDPDFGQAQICGRFKLVNEIPTLPLLCMYTNYLSSVFFS